MSALSNELENWVGCGSNSIRSLDRAPALSPFLNCQSEGSLEFIVSFASLGWVGWGTREDS